MLIDRCCRPVKVGIADGERFDHFPDRQRLGVQSQTAIEDCIEQRTGVHKTVDFFENETRFGDAQKVRWLSGATCGVSSSLMSSVRLGEV